MAEFRVGGRVDGQCNTVVRGSNPFSVGWQSSGLVAELMVSATVLFVVVILSVLDDGVQGQWQS
jgi:hypothetical protein